jgi:TATA-box binding protein (TBP) (component of TFIID and TFIIIB)
MTAVATFVERVDVRALVERVRAGEAPKFRVETDGFSVVAFKYDDAAMNVRVFESGAVHIAGARSTAQVRDLLRDLAFEIMVSSGVPDERYAADALSACVERVSVPLLNLSIVTNSTFSLVALHEALSARGFASLYGSSCGKKSPGLRLRLESATVSFYRSGKIVVSASGKGGADAGGAFDAAREACFVVARVLETAASVGAVTVGAAGLPKRPKTARFAMFVNGRDVSAGDMISSVTLENCSGS